MRCCAASVTLLGVVVLVGWVRDHRLIKSVLPGLVEMKANTALCFLMSGVALWTMVSPRWTFRHRFSPVGAWVIIVTGLATSLEYLTGTNWGIDEIVFRDPPDSDAASEILPPGRMAFVSALAFVMAGCSLLLLRGRRTVIAQVLALSTALTALFSLATYLWSEVQVGGVEPYTALALHSALGFAVLAVGLLTAAPPHGPVAILVSPTVSGALARRLLPAAIGVTLVLGALELAGQRAGWYGTAYGMALFVLTNITLMCGIILFVAQRAFLSEKSASASTDHVRQLNEVLEQRVVERTEELAESERFTRSTLDALSAHIAILDSKGFILATNRTWRDFAIANAARVEVGVGANYLDACDNATGPCSEESAAVAIGIRGVIRGEHADFALEYPCHSPSEKRWFMARATRFTGDGPVRVVIAHENITAAKLADEERQKFVSLVENSTDFIGLTTFSGDVFYTNPAACELVERDPALCRTITRIADFYTDSGRRVLEDIARPTVMATGRWEGDIQLRNFRTGQPIDTLSSAFLVRHPTTGEPICIATITRDITDRKRTEVELQLAKKSADAANLAKSEFLANMSHEIRTPMNGIIGLTGLVLDTTLAPEQRDYLDGVMLSAQSMLTLINSILDFSKIEAGKLELEQINFHLRQALGAAMKVLALRAHEKNLELFYEVRPDVPDALIGDAARLWQVVINLVGNALKFTHTGEIGVIVELDEELSEPVDSVCLRFTVRDTGIGIPANKQNALFQPFSQLDNSTTRKYGGTGLGLTISAHLVELMGGRIWFESEEGNGTQFHFNARFARQPTAMAPLPRAELIGLHVLVADDNASQRRIQTALLTQWGMKATAVASGSAAIESLQAAISSHEPFDLILLDLNMPEMDGCAVLRRIRAMPEVAWPTILMLSWVNLGDQIALARELGAAAYLTKPVSPAELLNAIETALGKVNGPATTQPQIAPAKSGETRVSPLHILLVEDNAVNQLLAKRTLEKAGHSVVVANNGEEALTALKLDSFAVVLMDIQMPVMDGFQATARIRDHERTTGRHQQIVAMTAHALKGDRERCLAMGMDDYVSKPFRNHDLFAAIAAAAKQGDGGWKS